jgi:hypothetical protein
MQFTMWKDLRPLRSDSAYKSEGRSGNAIVGGLAMAAGIGSITQLGNYWMFLGPIEFH